MSKTIEVEGLRKLDGQVILAAKDEGAAFSGMEIRRVGGSVEETVRLMREEGYRIFYVLSADVAFDDIYADILRKERDKYRTALERIVRTTMSMFLDTQGLAMARKRIALDALEEEATV